MTKGFAKKNKKARMHVCTYARMHVCTYARMHVCTYVRMHVCTYVRMHDGHGADSQAVNSTNDCRSNSQYNRKTKLI